MMPPKTETSASALAARQLHKARTRVLLDHPFFAAILLRRSLTETDRFPTLAVDVDGNIFYNPQFVARLSTEEAVFALCHEVLHVIGRHAMRRGMRDRERWVYAADAWVNDTLRLADIGTPVSGAVDIPGSRYRSVDEIYESLPERLRSGRASSKNDGGKGQSDDHAHSEQWDNGIGDDLIDGSHNRGRRREAEASVRLLVGFAAQEAKRRGRMSAELERMVDDLMSPKMPWQQMLERFMIRCARDDIAWRRPNKRFIAQGIYLPSMSAEIRMGTIVVGIDTSGSIDDRSLSVFVKAVNDIAEGCRPEAVYLVYCDTRVQRVDRYTADDFPLQVRPKGGGGTDLREVFAFVDKEGLAPDCLLLLTDCCTPWPDAAPWPTLVCSTSSQAAPAHLADTIHFPGDA